MFGASSSLNEGSHQKEEQQQLSIKPPGSPRSRTKEAATFNHMASLISKGIHLTSLRLGKLANLVKGNNNSNNMFGSGDAGQEINQLAISVKEDIALLNTQIAELQKFVETNLSNGSLSVNESSKIHSKEVVKTMELRLHDTGTKFQVVLEQRKHVLQNQYERRGQFVGSKASAAVQLGKPIQFSTTSTVRQRASPGGLNGSSPRNGASNGLDVAVINGDMDDGNDENNLLLIKSDNKYGGKQMQMQQNQGQFSYLESRVDAVRDIESHIVELGKVMGTLATMIAEQDHTIQEISTNIDDANDNIFSGVRELQKMYQRVQSNKRLILRLLAVLFVFLVFFILFAA